MRVAIIGAGMAGLACARRLADAGVMPVIFDKGRGIGGRLATRRVDGLQFDHGAQYVTARDAGFAAVLRGLQAVSAAGAWDDGSGQTRLVGLPGMSALARAYAVGLDIRHLAQVTSIRTATKGWTVHIGDIPEPFDRVVITVPAPQVAGLLGPDHPVVATLANVHLAPCLTLMAATHAPPAFVVHSDADDPLAWVAQDSSKPGRPQSAGPVTWVAQASPAFSVAHLEEDATAIVARMLPLLCDRLGITPAQITHASAHRWRYARVTMPLGQPFIGTDDTLFIGGDWCLGARVEAAWISGDAMGRAVLAC
jgi:renalase